MIQASSQELQRHYISATDHDIEQMLSETDDTLCLDDLFKHIPESLGFSSGLDLPEELPYENVAKEISALADKTNLKDSFIGDTLPVWSVDPIVDFVSKLRPLSTSYTPYQPERSQGTLVTHWIYQCALSSLTGFEAINTSLYDRSFAMFEAITCAMFYWEQTEEDFNGTISFCRGCKSLVHTRQRNRY